MFGGLFPGAHFWRWSWCIANRSPIWLIASLMLTSCGPISETSWLFGDSSSPKKTRCNSDAGFQVCLATISTFEDPAVGDVVRASLKQLNQIVNEDSFEQKLKARDGEAVLNDLRSTNYIVVVEGTCNPESANLALATVNGYHISYNECSAVHRNGTSPAAMPQVAGVLLHEISHNIGYNHENTESPDLNSVPYALGYLAEDYLQQGASAPLSSQAEGNKPNQRKSSRY